MTFVVTLTGGIGSGKSTVGAFFSKLDVPVIDADQIARDLVIKQTPCYQAIVEHFGNEILADDLTLNRSKIRKIVFSNQTEKEWLENLLHPKIIEEIKRQIQQCTFPYCIVIIPLYTEMQDKFKSFTNSVLVVDTSVEKQIERATKRDHSNEALIKKMIFAQATREQRRSIADELIDNNQDLKALQTAVTELHQTYLKQAKELVKP